VYTDSPVLSIYQRARRNPAFPHIGKLAVGLFGPGGFVPGDPSTLCGQAAVLVVSRGGYAIHFQRGLPALALSMPIACEIARWWSMGESEALPLSELAAAILLPSAAIKMCVESCQLRAEEIATMFHVPFEIAEQRVRVTCSPDESGEFPSIRLAIA